MSRDYWRDSRRVPLMKRLIDNEGIQAALTVPLLMGDEALGVLYAGHRSPYDWSEREQRREAMEREIERTVECGFNRLKQWRGNATRPWTGGVICRRHGRGRRR